MKGDLTNINFDEYDTDDPQKILDQHLEEKKDEDDEEKTKRQRMEEGGYDIVDETPNFYIEIVNETKKWRCKECGKNFKLKEFMDHNIPNVHHKTCDFKSR